MIPWSRSSVAETLSGIYKAIEDEAEAVVPGFDPDAIHKFRVGIKKLRALLRLLEAEDSAAAFKLPKKFKALYALTGAVRDAQVLLARATTEADPPLPDYTVWLAQEMAVAQSALEAFYGDKILKKTGKSLLKIDVPAIQFETLHTFYKTRLDEVERLLESDNLEDEDLHTARKRVKDLQHVAKICADAWPEGLEGLGEMANLDALELVAGHAGDYNDQSVALLSIERYLETAEKTKKPEKVRDAWVALKTADRSRLLVTIEKFRTGRLLKKSKESHSAKSADGS